MKNDWVNVSEFTQEVDQYIRLIEAIENSADLSLSPTMKGTVFLVIYNLIESVVKNCFRRIFDRIRDENVAGMELSEQIRRQWFQQLTRRTSAFDASPKTYFKAASELLDVTFEKSNVSLSTNRLPELGTLDAERISRMLVEFGIRYKTKNPTEHEKSDVRIVRRNRNDLAHGDKTFEECGREYAVEDLKRIRNRVVVFLKRVSYSTKVFAEQKGYRANP